MQILFGVFRFYISILKQKYPSSLAFCIIQTRDLKNQLWLWGLKDEGELGKSSQERTFSIL